VRSLRDGIGRLHLGGYSFSSKINQRGAIGCQRLNHLSLVLGVGPQRPRKACLGWIE